MARYDYRCTNCKLEAESEHTDACVICPECDAPMKRVFGLGGVILKGNGWYSKDK